MKQTLLIEDKLKTAFDTVSRQLTENPQLSTGVVTVEAKVIRNFTMEGKLGKFTFTCDEGTATGGDEQGPPPLQYFLAGLAFCEQVIFIRHAAASGIQIESMETTVRGYFDRRGIFGVAEVDPAFQKILVQMKISSSEEPERIRRALMKVQKHCPVYNTLKKACPVTHEATLNGKRIEV